jgi:hypothetical protein
VPDYLITTTIPTATVNIQNIDEKDPRKVASEKPAIRERIVRAKNEAAALKHVVADTITIARASIDDAMRLAGQGAKVETAAE